MDGRLDNFSNGMIPYLSSSRSSRSAYNLPNASQFDDGVFVMNEQISSYSRQSTPVRQNPAPILLHQGIGIPLDHQRGFGINTHGSDESREGVPVARVQRIMVSASSMYQFSQNEEAAIVDQAVYSRALNLPPRLQYGELSYEELLALQERVGNVKTGLSHVAIRRCVRISEFHSTSTGDIHDIPLCVICQADYEDLETIGTLECGHQYHDSCIQQWLHIRNFCPICRFPAMKKPEN